MRAFMLLPLSTALALAACSDDSSDAGSGGGESDAAPVLDDGAPVPDGRAAGDFIRFRRAVGGGPCPDDTDCSGFIELRGDRTLLLDRVGELPVVVHQAEVTRVELGAAIGVLSDPDLIEILDLGEPPCEGPSDIFESMTLILTTGEHMNTVTRCEDPALQAARDELQGLTDSYFPE